MQAVGLNVLFQRALQVVGPHVLGFAVWAATAASLQAVGLLVLGLTGACEQPPAASLQVVGPLVLGLGGVWAATRGFLASCRSVCSMTRLVGHGRHVGLASV